jgi:hypothetical protein
VTAPIKLIFETVVIVNATDGIVVLVACEHFCLPLADIDDLASHLPFTCLFLFSPRHFLSAVLGDAPVFFVVNAPIFFVVVLFSLNLGHPSSCPSVQDPDPSAHNKQKID